MCRKGNYFSTMKYVKMFKMTYPNVIAKQQPKKRWYTPTQTADVTLFFTPAFSALRIFSLYLSIKYSVENKSIFIIKHAMS